MSELIMSAPTPVPESLSPPNGQNGQSAGPLAGGAMAAAASAGETSGAAGAARFHLAIFDDHLRSFPMADGTLLVGRSQKNDLPIHDHLLSRKHCSLTLHGNRLLIADLHSANGTYVNGALVTSRELKLDDIIEIGQTVMVVFDGRTWDRGMGLLNLRNPIKAQELVHRLRDPQARALNGAAAAAAPEDPPERVHHVRALDRLIDSWQRQDRDLDLPALLADRALDEIVTTWLRRSKRLSHLYEAVIDDALKPNVLDRCQSTAELRAALEVMIRRKLAEPSPRPPAARPEAPEPE
ncbi:MAG: FHA domain-containing protein [Planctomycetota bacterium]